MLFNRHFFISCVVNKHQLSLAKVGDFSEKNGMLWAFHQTLSEGAFIISNR